jgi:phosphoribosylanthranilate isomerase
MSVRAKICGIRRPPDLDIAVRSGADAIGLISGITHVSEDNLTPDEARRLAQRVPPFVSTVLVTHLQDATEILELGGYVGADTIQIHGLVDPETTQAVFERWPGRITKAVHVTGASAVEDALAYADICHAIHLDSRTQERLGGTGQTHDWAISARVVGAVAPLPVYLAGGLRPENVAEAVARVRPAGVDVNSGVEGANGRKEEQRMRAFVAHASAGLQQGRAAP